MKLGVPWTSKGKKGPESSARSRDADAASVHDRLDDLTRQLEQLSRVTAGKIRPPGAAADSRAHEELPAKETDPQGRPDPQPDADAGESPTANSEVARFAGDRTLNRNPLRPVYADPGFDKTMAEIAARQRALDGERRSFARRHTPDGENRTIERRRTGGHRPAAAPAQDLSGLEEALRKITVQVESLRRPCPVEDAVPALRQELSEISRSLAEAVPRQAIEAIEAEVRGLAERLDQSRQCGIDTSALVNLDHGLAEVRDALQSLRPAESLVGFQNAIQGLSHKIDTVVATQQDPMVLQQLEAAISGLRGIVAHVASDDTLARLTDEIRGISARLDRIAGSAAKPDALSNLERRIGAIAEKIEKQQFTRGDSIAFGQLEERVAKLLEKLDASGSRFSHLDAIERGLTDVLVHLEEQRARAGAAMRATGADPVLESLKRDLDAVNGTLNRVVERLAMIETGIRSGGRPASAPAGPGPAAQPPAASAVPAKAPVLPASAAAAQSQRPAVLRERPPIDPNLPPDHPLEPGAARAQESAADRIAASEAALGPAKPPVIPDPGGKTNFIAAARQAAQAASRLGQELDRKSDDGGGGHAGGSVDKGAKPLRQRLTGRIRSMLVGASVFILVLGAAHVAMTLLDEPVPPDALESTPSTPQQPAPAPKPAAQVTRDPTGTGSPPKPENAQRDAASETPALTPAPGFGANDPSAAVSPWHTPATPPNDPLVTGSISPTAGTQNTPQSLPLPPNRPDGQGQAEPESRLAAAAAAGNAAAAYELAVRHIEGRGVRRSYEQAAQWLTRASKQGLAPAQFRLGSLYEKGLGVGKNLNEARRLYAAAAEKGNAKAMHNLAVLYAEGGTAKPDYPTALRWFRKAADRGIADSQYNLGVLFARGAGVEQNLAESYKWFALAAQQGDKEAARKRDDIAARLDADSLMAARLAVKTWTVEPQPEEAITVKAPPGGWDQSQRPASVKRRPRSGGPLKLGPG